ARVRDEGTSVYGADRPVGSPGGDDLEGTDAQLARARRQGHVVDGPEPRPVTHVDEEVAPGVVPGGLAVLGVEERPRPAARGDWSAAPRLAVEVAVGLGERVVAFQAQVLAHAVAELEVHTLVVLLDDGVVVLRDVQIEALPDVIADPTGGQVDLVRIEVMVL